MEVEPPVGDATAPAVAAAAADSEEPYVAPSEEEQDAPPADGIVMSDRVLGYYGNSRRDGRTAEQRSVVRDLGLKWGEYYVPDDMLDQLRENGADSSVGSDEDMEMEEAEAEEEAVYEDAMTCLGMKMVGEDAVMGDETTGAPSPNSIVSRNGKCGKEVDAPVTAAGAAASLGRLPETVLQQIFLYTFNPQTKPYEALPLERVCKAMHWALRPEGKFWDLLAPRSVESLGQVAYGGKIVCNMRERYMWTVGFRHIRKYQKSCDNVILSVLEEFEGGNGADNFRNVAANVLAKMMTRGSLMTAVGTPRLRGDTVGYLAELLQARAIERLEAAKLVAIHARPTDVVVTRDDLLMLDKAGAPSVSTRRTRTLSCNVGLKQHHSAPNSCSCLCTSFTGIQWRWPEDDCLIDEVLPAEARRRIVRRLAYRAGIVKLTSEVFDLVAAEMFHSLGVLLVDAFEASTETHMPGENNSYIHYTDQYLTYGEPCNDVSYGGIDMFSTPPPPMPASENPDKPYESGYAYTIVPGQIKNSALKRFAGQGGSCHVYGDTWAAGSRFTCVEEKEKEQSYYFSKDITAPSRTSLEKVQAERDELARRLATYEYDSDYESESDDSWDSDEDYNGAGAMYIG